MTRNRIALSTVCLSVLAMTIYVVQVRAMAPKPNEESQSKESQSQDREVTLVGQVVDLHTFMIQKTASAEETVKMSTECIKDGVPTALRTEDGLVILGQGSKSPAKVVLPLAFKNAEVTGNLFTRDGIKYLDITGAKPATEAKPAKGAKPEPR